MVAAPFGLVEAGVAPEDDPVGDGMDEQVLGGAKSKVSDVMKHTI